MTTNHPIPFGGSCRCRENGATENRSTDCTAPAPVPTDRTGVSRLWVRSTTARSVRPVGEVSLTLRLEGGEVRTGRTDETGIAVFEGLACPPAALSLDESNTRRPYAVCGLTAEKQGYDPQVYEGLQLFDGQTSMLTLELIPAEDPDGRILVRNTNYDPQVFDVPSHKLFAGGPASGPQPVQACASARILAQPVIPNRITVHLGRPAASARNVTVSFRDYIKNVASSEVYPTWVSATKPIIVGPARFKISS